MAGGGAQSSFVRTGIRRKATMRKLTAGIVAAVMVAAVTAGTLALQRDPQGSASHQTVTKADYDRWKAGQQTSLPSNWGRWGKDDEIGTLNLITPAKRKEAAALVKEGVSVSLAVDANTVKAIDNDDPYEVVMLRTGSDRISVAHHSVAHTHVDSLAHHFDVAGAGYNGYKPDEALVMKLGHPKNSIYNLKNGVFTRGILLDIPRLKGLPYLEPGTPIYVEDLEAAEKMEGVKVQPGDALFIRTGVWPYREKFGPYARGRNGKAAGLHASVIPWLKQRDIALLSMDQSIAVSPSEIPAAVHDFSMVALGIHLIDNSDPEAVAVKAAGSKRWEFLLTVAPLPIRGATGSPVNPIATF
jgi:kynurenine formamidase